MRVEKIRNLFSKNGFFVFPVEETVVSESYAYPLGIFRHGEIDKSLKLVSFA